MRFLLPPVLLLLRLTSGASAQATATSADTAYARAVLSNALEAFGHVRDRGDPSHLTTRFNTQLSLWRMHDQAWNMALQRDTAPVPNEPEPTYWLTGQVLAALYDSGDSTALGSRIASLSPRIRDRALSALLMLRNCRPVRDAQRLLSSIQELFMRARAMAGAWPCNAADSARAHATIRAAIELVGDSITGYRANEVKMWHYRLRQLGGGVSVSDLVRATERELRDRSQAQLQVAEVLIQQKENSAAKPLLDSLQEHYSQTVPRAYGPLARVHQLRGTAADSAIARALRDTLDQLRPIPPAQATGGSSLWSVSSALQSAVDSLDRTRTETALLAAMKTRDPVGLIVNAANQMRHRNSYRPPGPESSRLAEAQLEFAEFLYQALWNASSTLPALARDSARVAVVALLASVDEQRALTVAQRQVATRRMRDRAIAAAVQRLAQTDADAAAAAADPLQNPEARNVAYLALAERAVAGGRLVRAARFADRTASGDALVRAQFAIANALFALDSVAHARRRITGLLPHLDPVWTPEGYFIAADTSTVLHAQRSGTNRYLLGSVVLLGFRTGAAAELRTWATTRPTAHARAAAGLVVAEGLAQYRLGWWPNYPTH